MSETDRSAAGGRRRALRRSRRENVEGGRRSRIVVRASPEEELRLRVLAQSAGVSVQRLLVETTLAVNAPELGVAAGAVDGSVLTLTERRQAAAELFQISRLLGTVANNVNQMARATNATGEWQPELAATLAYLRERLGPRIESAVDEVVAP